MRTSATLELKKRDLRDFAGKLITLVQKPFEYEVKPISGPGSTGRLVLKRDKTETEFTYQFPGVDPSMLPRFFSSSVAFDPFSAQNLAMATAAAGGFGQGFPGLGGPNGRLGALSGMSANGRVFEGPDNQSDLRKLCHGRALRTFKWACKWRRNVQMTNQMLQQKLQEDIQLVERTNVTINQLDERVLPVLKEVTGQDFGVEPAKWKKWWATELGYLPEREPDPKDAKPAVAAGRGSVSQTCFALGTLVHTLDGRRPIELVQLGDRVLSQNTTTGELSFQPVVRVEAQNAKPLLRFAFEGEGIRATPGERFWTPGTGWTMARDLGPKDRVRGLGGSVPVNSKADEPDRPVFSLEVAQNHDFFVGGRGLLVHDAGLVQPVEAPFDRAPDLAAADTPPAPR